MGRKYESFDDFLNGIDEDDLHDDPDRNVGGLDDDDLDILMPARKLPKAAAKPKPKPKKRTPK